MAPRRHCESCEDATEEAQDTAIMRTSGGLIVYGADYLDLWKRAASYVDRILKGEKPSDLPVQAPVKFETVINLRAAKALGIGVPDSVLGPSR
jgi:ABC-type uncharacterized transport system substrate-binding protein